MHFSALVVYLFALAAGIAASPTAQHARKVARAPMPIPTFHPIDPLSRSLLRREDDPIYGGYYTEKKPNKPGVMMQAPFNRTLGSTWCNEMKDLADDNWITKAHLDSFKKGDSSDKDKPPQYVCFFYETKDICDPKKGNATYIESMPGKYEVDKELKGGKYHTWGCQWHPKLQECIDNNGWKCKGVVGNKQSK